MNGHTASEIAIQYRNDLDTVAGIFSRFDTLTHPDKLIAAVQELSVVWAVVFLIAGLVAMLNGYKLYKWVTVVIAMGIGAVAGQAMGQYIRAPYIVAACLGALLAVAAWPLMKYAVAIVGGIVGAFVGANMWGATAKLAHAENRVRISDNYWVGALLGLVICGMLAFILFKVTVVLFTSVSGATIALIGALVLILQVPQWRDGITAWSQSDRNALVFPLLVFIPAAIGLIFQHAHSGKLSDPAGGGKSGGGKQAAAH